MGLLGERVLSLQAKEEHLRTYDGHGVFFVEGPEVLTALAIGMLVLSALVVGNDEPPLHEEFSPHRSR